jgi:major membrane immunogen (membrane-anchored lipoprotein)
MYHPILYKYDLSGRIRQWWIESTEEAYRTHSGLLDGKIVTSGWQYPTEKNVGKVNATTVSDQVLVEVASKYEHQKYQGKYADSIQEAQSGAKFVECMLAASYDPKKNKSFPYWSQPKLDGCLSGDTYVYTELGKMTMKQLYESDARFVASYDPSCQKVEFKKILGKYKNAHDVNPNKNKKWMRITLESGKTINLTFDHRVFLPDLGVWREAKDLETEDKLLIL